MFCSTPQISNRVQMMLKHGFETCIISLERVNIRSRFQFMFFLTSRYTLFQRTRDRVRNIIVSRNPRIFMLVITCCVLAIPEPRVHCSHVDCHRWESNVPLANYLYCRYMVRPVEFNCPQSAFDE